jgi:hypothetical protein
MFASKIGEKCMSHRALSIYKNKLVDAWIAVSLSATTDAHSAI